MNNKELSKMIRDKKKNLLKPDMDYAGQDALDPDTAEELMQASEVNSVLGDPDHDPASAKEMGEDESSQELSKRKLISARIKKMFQGM